MLKTCGGAGTAGAYKRRRAALYAAISLGLSLSVLPIATLRAQLIGSEPSSSPFRDADLSQRISLSVGWLDATRDAARVGPKAGPVVALRHDIHLGGIAWLTSRYSLLRSERNVVDPGSPASQRDQGVTGVTHHYADVGFTLALTGKKTWRGVLPTLGTNVGVVSDFSDTDIGGYRFGTKFSFGFGPGVLITLPRGYNLRLDITNTVHQFQYPGTYFIAASDSTSVLTDTEQRAGWRSNWGITTGLSFPIFR